MVWPNPPPRVQAPKRVALLGFLGNKFVWSGAKVEVVISFGYEPQAKAYGSGGPHGPLRSDA